MDKQETFAKRLKEALELSGLTKADLSRMTGISKSSLTHYEKGDWEGKQDAVYKIARALKVPESWLMGFGASTDFEELQRSHASRLLRAKVANDPDTPSGQRLYFLMDNSNIPMAALTRFAEISEEALLDWINNNTVPNVRAFRHAFESRTGHHIRKARNHNDFLAFPYAATVFQRYTL